MRVVLDTNVIISGYIWGGKPGLVLRGIFKKEYDLYTSQEQILELASVLYRVKFITSLRRSRLTPGDIIKNFKQNSITVMLRKIPDFIVDDPADNLIIALASAAKADYLITGDAKHVLPIKKIGKTKIIDPDSFLKIVKK